METLSRHMLNPRSIHAALLQHVLVRRREVFPHHADHAHLRKVAGGQREMGGSASQRMVYTTAWSLNAVERNTTHHHNRHAVFPL